MGWCAVHWAKLLPVTAASHRAPVNIPAAPCLVQLLANTPGKQQQVAQVLGAMPPARQAWVKFLFPSFSLAQLWPLGQSGELNKLMEDLFLSLSPTLHLFQINKSKKQKSIDPKE